MKTTYRVRVWLVNFFLAVGIYLLLVVQSAYAASTVTIANSCSYAVRVKFELQSIDGAHDNLGNFYYVCPARSTIGPFAIPDTWYGFQSLQVDQVQDGYPGYTATDAGQDNALIGANVGSHKIYVRGDNYSLVRLEAAPAGSSGGSSDPEIDLDILEAALWSVLALGFVLFFFHLARMIGRQNNLPV